MANHDDGAWLLGVQPQLDRQQTPQEHAAIARALHRAGYSGPSRHETQEDVRALARALLIALRNSEPDRQWTAVWSQELGPGVDGNVGCLTTQDLPPDELSNRTPWRTCRDRCCPASNAIRGNSMRR